MKSEIDSICISMPEDYIIVLENKSMNKVD